MELFGGYDVISGLTFWLLSRKLLGRFWWNFVCCLGSKFHCCHYIFELIGSYDIILALISETTGPILMKFCMLLGLYVSLLPLHFATIWRLWRHFRLEIFALILETTGVILYKFYKLHYTVNCLLNIGASLNMEALVAAIYTLDGL